MPKKSKATKVTDIDSPWNRKRQIGYKVNSIPIKKTILIVCEGQTEELYFKSFPVITQFKVETFDTKGQSKLKLVETTKDLIKSFNIKFDEVWCVFDMDVKRGSVEYADFDNSIEKAYNLGFKVAYSNDSFELWFYLHYYYNDNQNLRTFYNTKLSEILNFVKNKDFCLNIYNKLLSDERASQQKAIERSKKLFESQKHLKFHLQNPITKVYELVELLNENLKR